jgi:hypothetical protein
MVYVGFSTPRTWNPLSAAIRKVTGSRTSHAYLLFRDPLFRILVVMEAHSTGFRVLPYRRFRRENRIVATIAPDHDLTPGLHAAGKWLGEQFDVAGLLRMGLELLRRWAAIGVRRQPLPGTRALFCSEAVVRALQAADFPQSDALDPENVTPQELFDWLKAHGGTVIEHRPRGVRRLLDVQRRRRRMRRARSKARRGRHEAAAVE